MADEAVQQVEIVRPGQHLARRRRNDAVRPAGPTASGAAVARSRTSTTCIPFEVTIPRSRTCEHSAIVGRAQGGVVWAGDGGGIGDGGSVRRSPAADARSVRLAPSSARMPWCRARSAARVTGVGRRARRTPRGSTRRRCAATRAAPRRPPPARRRARWCPRPGVPPPGAGRRGPPRARPPSQPARASSTADRIRHVADGDVVRGQCRPARRRVRTFAGSRTRSRTSWPAAINARAVCEPVKPVPPVTSTFTLNT